MITIEKLFRQEVLKTIEDFDSPKNYKAWLDDIRISKRLMLTIFVGATKELDYLKMLSIKLLVN